MKISVFGGTGFVGSNIVNELLDAGHVVTLLTRSKPETFSSENVFSVAGSITDQEAVDEAVSGSDAVIYSIGIIREISGAGNITYDEAHFTGVKNAAMAAEKAGAERFILISAFGAKKGGTAYQDSKYRGEEFLKGTSLDWTIFAPSLIFGDPGNNMEFCTQVLQEIVLPFRPAPLFFPGVSIRKAGKSTFTPVQIRDVVAAVVSSIDQPISYHKKVFLCGRDQYSWKELLEMISVTAGKKKIFVPVPATILKIACKLFEKFPWFPISSGQIEMVTEGNAGISNCTSAGLPEPVVRFSPEELQYLKNRISEI